VSATEGSRRSRGDRGPAMARRASAERRSWRLRRACPRRRRPQPRLAAAL